jgi:hypothetical protein
VAQQPPAQLDILRPWSAQQGPLACQFQDFWLFKMLIFSQTLSSVIFNGNLLHLLVYQWVRILIEMSSNKINAFPRQNNNEKQRTAWPC